MKNILFLDHSPFIGGAELVLAKHIEHLDKSKYKPSVICSPNYTELIQQYKNAGAEVFTIHYPRLKTRNPLKLPKYLINLCKTMSNIEQIAKKTKADLIVTNTARAWLPGTFAAKRQNAKLIWFIRDYTYPRILFKILVPLADGVTFVSKRLKHYYVHNKGPTYGKVQPSIRSNLDMLQVIYVGSDMHERIDKLNQQDIARVRDEFNIQDDNVVVGFVGRLVKWKGASVLLRAIRKLKYQNPNYKQIKVLVIGSGKEQEGNIEQELANYVQEYNLTETVYLTGQRDDVPALLQVMDIFVHPSIEPEPFATTVVEAMQAGVAVIGNTIGGTPEIIEDEENGLLVEPNDPTQLAKAIAKLVEDNNFRAKIAKNGKEKALNGYTEAIITKQVQNLYKQALSE